MQNPFSGGNFHATIFHLLCDDTSFKQSNHGYSVLGILIRTENAVFNVRPFRPNP